MKIRDLSFVAIQAPLPEGKAYGMAKSLATARATTLVRLVLEDGTEGNGECWGMPLVNLAMLPLLKGYLIGVNVLDVEHAFAQMFARHYHFGVQGPMTWCISGIDMAAKDAAGKMLRQPVHRLIGGKQSDHVHIYASGGYLTENSTRDFEPQIELMARGGHKAVKIKIGVSPANDEERVGIARRILGPDVEIMVDINSNYTLDLARESITRMAPHGLGWIEEPLSPQDFSGYELLQRWSPVPIATGEALYSVFDFKRLVDRRSVDVVQPDLSLCGGFWQGRQIAQLAAQEHLRLSPHVWGSGIGLAAAIHFVASLPVSPHSHNIPRPTLVEYDLGTNPLRDGILRNPPKAEGGRIAVSDAPGLGIEIDWDAVEHHVIR
ncbi:mandelate racemase/muconate lactonizing enzyme family protein [Phreatobacter aquaticus]|uniref:Mandelate racemase/muconate lactonizing enzyme family protein n=1 Tax=Phreatobacter aquaticus TaxID=2570229 RepID=A0A4D7QK11_9HYPH|nr:mandelate racemase/muconate lactonizing enzyme family protein [Phreatobacter aquaticus]QCK87435.1 mandelate racemase/muconate lactonizing enzyme family protein [Phreatobacter aquaticus]